MECTSADATSADRDELLPPLPGCVSRRAEELLDLAVVKLLAICLGATVTLQVLALLTALFSPPVLHYIPEVGR